MNKKISLIVSVVLVLVIALSGYYYWKTKIQKLPEIQKSATEQATEDIQKIVASTSASIGSSVSPNVTVPTINPIKTDANPYNKTNPFTNLNPFQ